MNINDILNEEKVRLDPKCWKGKKIGNPKTKIKGGVRVNNCVPAESVAETKADPTSTWVVYDGNKVKRFKTHQGAKAYAEQHGGKVASSAHYADKIQGKQGVAEAEKKPHPKTWHDVDPKLGKAVDKMSQAEKVKKGYAHPDTLKKKGVAEGADVSSQIKRIKDRILQLKDWNTAGTHDKKIKELQTKLKELQSQKQGVAEGDYDIRRDPTYQKYNPETHTMMYKDGKHKAVKHDQVAKAKSLGWKVRSSLKAFAKGQSVAEGTGNGYYYLQGGIERSKKFASEAEAMAHSKQFFQLARVSRVTLKYKEPGQPAVVVKEFTFKHSAPPKSQMSWGDFYLQGKKQGMSEDFNAEYDDEAGMADNNLETLKRAVQGIDNIIQPGDNLPEWCQEKIAVAKSMLVAVWDYMASEEDRGAETELAEEFDMIERIIESIAAHNGVDAEEVWADLESLTEDELYAFAVTSQLNEDWQKANKRDKTDGMSRKAVKAYRREHPGSKLQTAVTTKPSKLKKGSKASKRRKSYCSRSRGQMKMHNISCAKTPDKAICKARRRWNC